MNPFQIESESVNMQFGQWFLSLIEHFFGFEESLLVCVRVFSVNNLIFFGLLFVLFLFQIVFQFV